MSTQKTVDICCIMTVIRAVAGGDHPYFCSGCGAVFNHGGLTAKKTHESLVKMVEWVNKYNA